MLGSRTKISIDQKSSGDVVIVIEKWLNDGHYDIVSAVFTKSEMDQVRHILGWDGSPTEQEMIEMAKAQGETE